jgi:hypothetical protein
MAEPKTLVQIAGREATPCRLGESALIMIDCQNTYTTGRMKLSGIEAALEEAALLLSRAREAGTPVIHVMHDGGPGSLYDLSQEIGRIAEQVAPADDEATIVKTVPNAFARTDLHERLQCQLDGARRLRPGLSHDRGGQRHRHPRPAEARGRHRCRQEPARGEPGRSL